MPSYDDFDDETASWAPQPSRPAVEPSQIQGAEKPRGPHKTPAAQPRGNRAGGTFGAGIFE